MSLNSTIILALDQGVDLLNAATATLQKEDMAEPGAYSWALVVMFATLSCIASYMSDVSRNVTTQMLVAVSIAIWGGPHLDSVHIGSSSKVVDLSIRERKVRKEAIELSPLSLSPLHPGIKPSLSKIGGFRLDLSPVLPVKKHELQYEMESEDFSYVEEARARAPSSGNAMDGEDVGFAPLELCLPRSPVLVEPLGPMGRSIFSAQFMVVA